jgi:hypothetical protein
VTPRFAVNDLVTGAEEMILPLQGVAVCSKVLDLLKIRSPWAGLPTNLERRSKGDTALATALPTGEGMVAILSIRDMAVSSNLSQHLAEASAAANALLHHSGFPVAANHRNSETPWSSVGKDAQSGAEGEQRGDQANRRQFQAALLENCSFFADLVLRQVRAGGNSSHELGRDPSREKLNVVRVWPTPRGSKERVVLGPRPEEPVLPQTPSFLLPALWVEVGCRHLQTVVSEKERR